MTTDQLFDTTAPIDNGWHNRRDDLDHATDEQTGLCADERCALFPDVYRQAFDKVHTDCLKHGGLVTADKVRNQAKVMEPTLQPCHTGSIGAFWNGWERAGLIGTAGAGHSAATGANGRIYHVYKALIPPRQLDMFEP